MATFVYAVAFVAFWLGWYAPAPILSRSITIIPQTRDSS
jgi:hypothetical protein